MKEEEGQFEIEIRMGCGWRIGKTVWAGWSWWLLVGACEWLVLWLVVGCVCGVFRSLSSCSAVAVLFCVVGCCCLLLLVLSNVCAMRVCVQA